MSTAQLSPHFHLTSYEGSQILARHTHDLSACDESHQYQCEFATATWKLDTAFAATSDAQDFILTACLKQGSASQVAFGLELHCSTWSRENFLVLPGAVYEGNRFNCREKAGYPPSAAQTGDVGPDAPTTIGDIPRLSNTAAQSRLQLLSADMATPAIGYFDPELKIGVWVLTPQSTRLGQIGYDFKENLDTGTAVIRLTAPGVREGTRYHGMTQEGASPDRAPNWQENEVGILHVRVVTFPCADRLSFLSYFNELRYALVAPAAPREPFALSSARALIEEKFNRDNWSEELGIYSSDTHRGENLPSWQSGWVGGGIVNYPLLVQGTSETSARSRKHLDWICSEAIAPSGFFKGMFEKGKWTDDSFGHSDGPTWHMTRKSADLLLFLVKQIDWANNHGQPAPASWKAAAAGCADAFARLWETEKQIGQFVDEENGALLVGGSDSAAILPAALTLAAKVLTQPAYDVLAQTTAEYFWEKFALQGYTTGGPGEILSAPDSESAFGLLESLVARWEATGEAVWLERAEAAAAYCATWCVSYDFVFPVNSTFGAMQMSTTGTVIANGQNKHSSPGICTLSGDSLFRLYRATGKPFYLRLMQEIATSLPQYVSRKDRPIIARYNGGSALPGWICERVNLSDWLEPVGEIFLGSCWCEVSLLLTALEIPTLYFRPDTGLLVSLDQIEARLVACSATAATLEITNPTAFPVQVRIFSETTTAAASPLPLHAFVKLPVIELAANQVKRVSIPS